MSSGEPKRPRPTLRFNSADLAKRMGKPQVAAPAAEAPETSDAQALATTGPVKPEDLPRSRTPTLHDPMTMALLAEVARTSQTVEQFDPELVEAVLKGDDAPPSTGPHPRIKRR